MFMIVLVLVMCVMMSGTSLLRIAGGMRRGYMGHLTRIANTIVHNLEKGPVHTQINTLITGVCRRKQAEAK